MKEMVYKVLDWLMQMVILSSIVLVGCLTLVGTLYGIMMAFVYLQENESYKWKQFITLQKFGQSVALLVLTCLVAVICGMNGYIAYQMTGMGQMLLFVLISVFAFVYLVWLFQVIWELIPLTKLSQLSLKNCMAYTIVNLPHFMGLVILGVCFGIIIWLIPQMVILLLGIWLYLAHRILRYTRKKFKGIEQGETL